MNIPYNSTDTNIHIIHQAILHFVTGVTQKLHKFKKRGTLGKYIENDIWPK